MSTILAFDPGFASFGAVAVSLQDPEHPVLLDWEFFETKKSQRKERRDVDDRVVRAAYLYRELRAFMLKHKPLAFCAEAFSPSRDASASSKVALAWGLIVALSEERCIPIVQPSPQDVKLAVAGSRSASKEDVKLAVDRILPGLEPALVQGKLARGKWEHVYDALAVALSSRADPLLRGMLRLSTST